MAPANVLGLEKLPDTSEIPLWADYVELRCLTHLDLQISREDVLHAVKQGEDQRRGVDEYADAEDPDDEAPEVTEDVKSSLWAGGLFEQLSYRERKFADFYPFEVADGGETLVRKRRITQKHRLYAFFLLAANLRHVRSKTNRNKFTSAFELASLAAMKRYLPGGAEVHVFGQNPLNQGRYSGKLLAKVKLLAGDLRERFIGIEDEYDPRDTGDGGLDLVGWVPTKDNAPGFLIIFAQCGCSLEEWEGKQFSPHPDAWSATLTFKVRPTTMMFIPHCYRRNTGEWHRDRKVHTILMDRLRLVDLLRGSYRTVRGLPCDLVKAAVEQRMPVP
ncbi:hypothetical protein ACFL09_03620 [Planctomycetota bacterium]